MTSGFEVLASETASSACPPGTHETFPNMGVLALALGRPGGGMEWRVTIELSCVDGTKQTHEVARGGVASPHSKHGRRTAARDDLTLPCAARTG
jgi:hypothetical protein